MASLLETTRASLTPSKNNPQYVLLLNNYTEIAQDDWLSKMVAAAEVEGNVGIVGCKLIYPNEKHKQSANLSAKHTYTQAQFH